MQHDPHDITELLAHLDYAKGVRRADRIVNGIMVVVLLLGAVAGIWVWL